MSIFPKNKQNQNKSKQQLFPISTSNLRETGFVRKGQRGKHDSLYWFHQIIDL